MAESVGVSKGQDSRKTIEAGERIMKEMAERDFSDLDIQMVWIDGIRIGSYHFPLSAGHHPPRRHEWIVSQTWFCHANVTLIIVMLNCIK